MDSATPTVPPLLLGFGKKRLTPTYSLSGFIGDTVRVRHVVCAITAEHSIRHTVKNVLCCFATAGGYANNANRPYIGLRR
jgi:hypothetical protein